MITTLLDQLANLAAATSGGTTGGTTVEGNCYTYHHSVKVAPELTSKQANLSLFGSKHKRVLEIGFNAGHSAALFLAANPDLRLTCVDIGLHSYVQPCYELLRETFGDRITLIIASSLELTVKLDRSYYKTFDGVHVDGNHEHPWYIYDTMSCLRYLADSAEFIMGGASTDTQDASITRWVNFMKGSILFGPAEGYQSTKMYQHEILQFTRPKVTVATVVVGAGYTQTVAKATQSLVDYCDYWQVELVKETNQLDDRPIPWTKIKLLQRLALAQTHVLVWIDADIVITNRQHSLDERIIFLSKDKDLLLAQDHYGINTGCFFMTNNIQTRAFLNQVYQQTQFINDGVWEQAAIVKLMQDDPSRAVILPVQQSQILNCYNFHGAYPQHQPDCWSTHFASIKGPGLSQGIEKVIKARQDYLGLSQANLDNLVEIVVSLW